MRYNNIEKGIFESRPNRFIAMVWINDKLETVHVKNTGRCRELLIKGVEVVLEKSENPNRKTKYDLIAVYKKNFGLINIDSQAPNKVVKEWLLMQDYDYIKPEYKFGNSRIDFYMEKNGEKYLMEVKGCTLEKDGVGYFPDAPTQRGIKHLNELVTARNMGYKSIIAFVIQMENIEYVLPNNETHKEFGDALIKAEKNGVDIVYFMCSVKEDTLEIEKKGKTSK